MSHVVASGSSVGRVNVPLPAVRGIQAFALIVGLVVNVYWAPPYYNWDVLPYIALTLRFAGVAPDVMHERTYAIASENVPAEAYERLTEGSEYHHAVATDPEALVQQLPGYALKPAYPLSMLVLGRIGMNPVDASVLISRVAYVLCGVVLLVWMAPLLSAPAAVVSIWAVMSLPVVLSLARLSTPDALSTVLILVVLWLVFVQRRFVAGACVLLLSLTVRPDNLLWLPGVAVYGAVGLRRRRLAAGLAIAGIAIYVVLARWSGYLGWATLFHHTFVERLSYTHDFRRTLSPASYAWIYLRESHPVNMPTFVLLFIIVGGALFVHRLRRYGWQDPSVALLAAAGAFVALHWLLLPGGEDRYRVVAYVTVLVVLIQTLVTDPMETVARHSVLPESHANPRRSAAFW